MLESLYPLIVLLLYFRFVTFIHCYCVNIMIRFVFLYRDNWVVPRLVQALLCHVLYARRSLQAQATAICILFLSWRMTVFQKLDITKLCCDCSDAQKAAVLAKQNVHKRWFNMLLNVMVTLCLRLRALQADRRCCIRGESGAVAGNFKGQRHLFIGNLQSRLFLR